MQEIENVGLDRHAGLEGRFDGYDHYLPVVPEDQGESRPSRDLSLVA